MSPVQPSIGWSLMAMTSSPARTKAQQVRGSARLQLGFVCCRHLTTPCAALLLAAGHRAAPNSHGAGATAQELTCMQPRKGACAMFARARTTHRYQGGILECAPVVMPALSAGDPLMALSTSRCLLTGSLAISSPTPCSSPSLLTRKSAYSLHKRKTERRRKHGGGHKSTRVWCQCMHEGSVRA
jgi:hypothetical protein